MSQIDPQHVHSTLKRYMLADGLDVVLDLKKSQGTYLYDAKRGKRFLDFFTCYATNPIGFNHPKLATEEFREKLARAALHKPSNSDLYTQEMAEFVAAFWKLAVPDYFSHSFFIEGGALAVENALKTAFDWKVRKNFQKGFKEEKGTQVIHFREAFHGRTGYTLSLTNTFDLRKTKYFPKFNWPRVLNPKITFPLNEENLEAVKRAEEESIRQIKQAIVDNPDDIAAIIIEPIQGEGGDNHFRGEFLRELRTIADENEIILIFDEVQTGVGLTGKMWAHQHFDVYPDIMAFGKKTQVCGIVATKRIDEVENNVFVEGSRINSTWGGNLVDMIRCQRYLEIIHEENLIENARLMGEYLLNKLKEIQEEFKGHVTNVRARGLFAAFDLPNPQVRDRFMDVAFNKGLLILKCGERSIRFRPPLDIKQEEIDEGMRLIRESLRECI